MDNKNIKNPKKTTASAINETIISQQEDLLAQPSSSKSVRGSPPSKTTTTRVESPTTPSEVREENTSVRKVRKIRDELRGFLMKDPSKVTKAVIAFVLDKWSETEDILMDIVAENSELKVKSNQLEGKATPQLSYASAVGLPQIPGRKIMQKKPNVVIKLTEVGKYESSDKVKEVMVSRVLKDMRTIKIRNIRKVRENGLLIETETEKDLQLIQGNGKLRETGLKAEEPKRVGPKLLIYDVDKAMKDSDLLDELYHRNIAECGISEQEFKKAVRV